MPTKDSDAPPQEATLIGVATNEAVRLSVDNGSKLYTFDDKLNPVAQD